MLSANVERQAQVARPRITVAHEEKMSAIREAERDRKKELGGGEGLSSTGQKLMITLASTCTDVFEAQL